MSERTTLRLVIHGRVQGVFYRESMRQEARRLAVDGWVRNRLDGTVEATLHGAPGAVEALVAWAWSGPADALVTQVEVEEASGDFRGFEKRPTA